MAWDLDGSTQYLQATISSGVLATLYAGDQPWTMAVRFNQDVAGVDTAFSLTHDTTNVRYAGCLMAADGTGFFALRAGAGEHQAATSNTVAATNWSSMVSIAASASSRICVLDGDWANRGTNGTSETTARDYNKVNIGIIEYSSGIITYWDGIVGTCAIWTHEFSQSDCEAWDAGVDARLIAPGSLVFGVDLLDEGNLVDYVGGLVFTKTAAPTFIGNPPGLILPSSPILVPAVAAAAAPTETLVNQLMLMGVGR